MKQSTCFALVFTMGIACSIWGCGDAILDKTPIITGRVLYECREYDPAIGAMGTEVVQRPVAGWTVFVSKNGMEFERVVTDANGYYRVHSGVGENLVLTCLAGRGPTDGNDGVDFQVYDPGADSSDQSDDIAHNVSKTITVDGNMTVDLIAPFTGNGGAFAICDGVNRGFTKMSELGLISGANPMAHVRAYWRRGMDTFDGTDWSFWRFPNQNMLFIRSFTPGAEETTEEDAWNPMSPLALMGYFVLEDYSGRGISSGGETDSFDYEPTIMWSKGFITFWACYAWGSSQYRFCAGYGATGTLDFDYDCEAGFFPAHAQAPSANYSGVFSRYSISSVLLDTFDGPTTSPADTDGDGVESGIWPIRRVITNDTIKNDDVVVFNDIISVWQSTEASTFGGLTARLATENIPWPATNASNWPRKLNSGDSYTSRCDSTRYVAAQVKRYHWDVVDLYELNLAADGTISISVNIAGTGSAPQDIDVYLVNQSLSSPIASAVTVNPIESISYPATAGTYIVVVTAYENSANAADYTITYNLL